METARAILQYQHMGREWWGYAVKTALFISSIECQTLHKRRDSIRSVYWSIAVIMDVNTPVCVSGPIWNHASNKYPLRSATNCTAERTPRLWKPHVLYSNTSIWSENGGEMR
ncbi:hypothetical protein CCR75_003638 [Bremia lactucae]|uniref:Uncharacterized protein n=1 Tax=Bremia lactucae TaxID=4779 RepID=A0A976NZW4_BRELC|nr:hypothetical protein CCR75_003638 [Bremia lactucae]